MQTHRFRGFALLPFATISALWLAGCQTEQATQQRGELTYSDGCTAEACGPAPLCPVFECGDGTPAGCTGRCFRTSDGVCGWEVRDCEPPPAECTDEECGIPPLCPAYECADGTIGGCTGRCFRRPDGACGWEIRDCEAPTDECTEEECGPAPLCPAEICADGTIGGCTGRCFRGSDGGCGWEVRDCPPAAR